MCDWLISKKLLGTFGAVASGPPLSRASALSIFLRSALIVGVYDDTAKSRTLKPGVEPFLYMPAACNGRKASDPVGHHQILGRFESSAGI